MSRTSAFVLVIVVLLAATAFTGTGYVKLQRQLKAVEGQRDINVRVLDFTKAFVKQVLESKQEVSFDERLKLENMVRGLGDSAVLTAWNQFVASKTGEEAQENVKTLLDLLVSKIAIAKL